MESSSQAGAPTGNGESRIVGILGGMGPAATADFYQKLIRLTPARTDQEHLRVVIWADPTVPDRNAALLAGGPDPTPWLLRGAANLKMCGAEFLVVPCNAAHAFMPRVVEESGLPLISLIESAVGYVTHRSPQPRRVGLLAANATLHSKLYDDAFEEVGSEVILPTEGEQLEVMAVIGAVKRDRVDAAARARLVRVSESLVARGAETIVAGCTEIVLALPEKKVLVEIVDPAQELARRVVDIAWRDGAGRSAEG